MSSSSPSTKLDPISKSSASSAASLRGGKNSGEQRVVDHTCPEWRCSICLVPSTQQCSLCKEVAYCGKAHQREDWANHKLTCKGNAPNTEGKCKLIYDYDRKGIRRGRKLITAKAIQAGELILREEPLVWVPKHDVKPHPEADELEGPTPATVADPVVDTTPSACVVCGEMVASSRTCSLCHWPVCSEACEKSAGHSSECQVFQGNRIPKHIQQLLPNRFLFVLRCLLLPTNDPRKWRQLMELEYNPEEMTKKYSPTDLFSAQTEDQDTDNKNTSSMAQKYDQGITKLLKYYGIKCEFQWVTHLMKVIKWNVIYDYDYDTRAMLFHLTSAARHSCLPNTEAVFKKSDGQIFLRALVDMKPGETIQISRDPLAIMLTAQVRQRRLKYLSGWEGFRCNCARCSDWTELGTNFATLQCRKELRNWGNDATVTDPSPCPSTLMATRPLDQNFEWRCPTCKFRVTGDLSEDKLGMRNLLSQVFHFADPDSSYIPDGIQTVDSFRYYFHQNHSFIFQTKLRLMDTVNLLCIQLVNSNPKFYQDLAHFDKLEVNGFYEMTIVQELLRYGLECLRVADSIFPGCSRIRGHILFFLGWAKWTQFKLEREPRGGTENEPGFVQFTDFIYAEEALKYLKQGTKILSFYKDVKDSEGEILKFGFNLSRKITQLLKLA